MAPSAAELRFTEGHEVAVCAPSQIFRSIGLRCCSFLADFYFAIPMAGITSAPVAVVKLLHPFGDTWQAFAFRVLNKNEHSEMVMESCFPGTWDTHMVCPTERQVQAL